MQTPKQHLGHFIELECSDKMDSTFKCQKIFKKTTTKNKTKKALKRGAK